MGIKKELATQAVGSLAGSEHVKIKLCALEQRGSNLLVLDEPTNHLDVNSKEALFEALAQYEGAVLLVSHEPLYAEKLCDEVFDADLAK